MKTPRFWQYKNPISTALCPASWLYGLGVQIDRLTTRSKAAALPIISIGNATAGGTGKTPVTIALAAKLQAMGFTPHILTRGYGGHARHAHRVTANDGWQQVGDEALLLAKTAPTWVGRNRLASAQQAAKNGANVALCDDAHQHYALQKTLSLLVIDGPYGIGNGRLMPAGPLREPFTAALHRADAVIIIGDDAHQLASRTTLPVFYATLTPTADIAALQQNPWLAFAGIGRPAKFFDMLRGLGIPLVATRSFADHHAYADADITALRHAAEALGARLLTTEKDAVKLSPEQAPHVTTVPVTLTFAAPDALADFLRARLT
jgi:tetraacyldisaccharide 4'-kinase